ncbi:MAG: hypothetical protein BMS9Abin23_0608 [Thermodesulfobacteriota bacterium]|nr:MAG: hypothetical protein BMS9Abin23_0608 [Thermodesulfobacteriota bacterium]
MIYRKNERIKWICGAVLLVLVTVFILLATYQIQHRDSDIFWALSAGQWIVGHLSVPTTDPFSYTFAGSEWVDFTWGFQVIAHFFYTLLGGWTGLFILQLLVSALIFAVLYVNLNTVSAGRVWLSGSFLIIVFAAAFPRLFIRPHLFGILFLSLYLLLLNLHEKKERAIFLLMLLPLQVLWINIHSSAVLGVFIVWAYASGDIIDGFIKGGIGYFREINVSRKRLLAASLLVPLVSVINPYGLKLVLFPFVHQAGVNADALRHIGEWVRLPYRELFFSLYPYPVNHFAFRLIFYGGIFSFFVNYRRLRMRNLIIFAAVSYMAATHARWTALFAFCAAPAIASNVSAYLDGGGRASKKVEYTVLLSGVFVALLMVGVFSNSKIRENYGLGVSGANFPVGTVDFMKREKITGPLYNSYVFGGYLIFNSPGRVVFIDGRTPTVYSPYFFWTTRLVNNTPSWKRLVAEYNLEAALVKIEKPFCSKLYHDEDWSPVVFDDVSVLYLKKAGKYEGIISQRGLDVNPCAGVKKIVLPSGEERLEKTKVQLKGVITALEDGGKGANAGFARPHRLLGLVYTELGGEENLKEAVKELGYALSVSDDSYTSYDMGVAQGKLKRRPEALKYFKASVAGNDKFLKGYLATGLTLFDMKEYGESARWLEKYTRLADDSAEYMGYRTLGRACFKVSRFACAERALKRAAFLTEDDAELAENFYYLGNALFEQGNYARGIDYYRRAVEINPEYAGVLKKLAAGLRKTGRAEGAEKIEALVRGMPPSSAEL